MYTRRPFSLDFVTILCFHYTDKMQKRSSHSCLCKPRNACLLAYETGSRQFCGQFIQVKAMGNVAAGRREMPSKVFNSTTVYLKNDEEAGGRERNAILVLTLLYVGNTLTVVIT